MKEETKKKLKKLEQEKTRIEKEIKHLTTKEELECFQSHKEYVGKYFKHKDKDKYFKVISQFASNRYRFTCLVFDLNENILSFNIPSTMHSDRFPEIASDIDFFNLEDIFAFSENSSFFKCTKEITKNEFEDAFNTKILMLLDELRSFPDEIEKEILYRYNKYYNHNI